MSRLTLADLRRRADTVNLHIEQDSTGYWFQDPATGEGPFIDGNYSASLEEVAGKLDAQGAPA